MNHNVMLSAMGLVSLMLAVVLPLFFYYHLQLAVKNRTTNEEIKILRLNFGLKNQMAFFKALMKKTNLLVSEYLDS